MAIESIRLNKGSTPLLTSLVKRRQANRQSSPTGIARIAVIGLAGLLASCGGIEKQLGRVGYVEGFLGGVAAEEPRAALIARDILSAGGTAADAVAAGALAMAVTLPGSAGLGGGGICLVYDAVKNQAESIDFQPKASAGGLRSVPSSLRGIGMLHARHGALTWDAVATPAESLARSGIEISRAHTLQLADQVTLSKLDAAAAAVYTSAAGTPLPEGSVLRQVELAGLMGRIKSVGVGDFYTGTTARLLVDGARAAGGDLTPADLRASLPVIAPMLSVPLGQLSLGLPYTVDGAVARALHTRLASLNFATLPPPARPEAMVTATRDGYNGAPAPVMVGAGLSAIDRRGNAVACTFTQGEAFGTGRLMRGTGLFLAPPPSPDGQTGLMPVIAYDAQGARSHLALATTGFGSATVAAQIAASLLVENRDLEDSLSRPRQYAAPDTVYLEPEAGDTSEVLKERGISLSLQESLSRAQAVFCPAGVPGPMVNCSQRPDPRGAGLALGRSDPVKTQ